MRARAVTTTTTAAAAATNSNDSNDNSNNNSNSNNNNNVNNVEGPSTKKIDPPATSTRTNRFALPSTRRRRNTTTATTTTTNNLEFKTATRTKMTSSSSSNNGISANYPTASTSTSSSSTKDTKSSSSTSTSLLPLLIAVVLWYSLGVVSISSSKVLLTPYDPTRNKSLEYGIDGTDGTDDLDTAHNNRSNSLYSHHHWHNSHHSHSNSYYEHVGGLSPLFLTLQQLLLGSTFLRLAIQVRFLNLTKGLIPLHKLVASFGSGDGNSKKSYATSSTVQLISLLFSSSIGTQLIMTGIYFSFGFLTTNMAFGVASPTYVETLKAAEPISSAVFAVGWGIEYLTCLEVTGLVGIIGGVLLSSQGSNHTASMTMTATATTENIFGTHSSSLVIATCIIVSSNFCFSLRGLYQKLFRNSIHKVNKKLSESSSLTISNGNADTDTNLSTSTSSSSQFIHIDDLNLQFRMQQTGVLLLLVPTLLFNGYSMVNHIMTMSDSLSTPQLMAVVQKYCMWSLFNGIAFSSYNLASTYLLTRISVVHHAALNCTRRIVAIVCTGLLFHIPITTKSRIGISISFVSFMIFSYAKSTKQKKKQKKQNRNRNKIPSKQQPRRSGSMLQKLQLQKGNTTTSSPLLLPPPPPPHAFNHRRRVSSAGGGSGSGGSTTTTSTSTSTTVSKSASSSPTRTTIQATTTTPDSLQQRRNRLPRPSPAPPPPPPPPIQ